MVVRSLVAFAWFIASALHAETGFVHTDGKRLVAPDGKPILLKGINLGNWLEPEGYMFLFEKGPVSPREIEEFFTELVGPRQNEAFWKQYRERYITEKDIRWIRQSGFNSVRIPLHYKLFLDDNGAGFPLLDRVIEWCRKEKLWVILDLHCAPGGQTGTNIDDSFGYPWLWEDLQSQDETVALWKRLAGHYRDSATVLGYDLLNEPIPHFPQLQKYNSRLEPFYQRVSTAIRQVDSHHVLIYGGAQWDSNFRVFGNPFDPNSMYTFHKYWMPPEQKSIAEYVEFRDRYNVPIWLGESGENTDSWVAQFRSLLEANGVGWCFWPYKKMEKTSAPVSFAKPANWDAVVEYAAKRAGTGEAEHQIAARPSLEQSRAVLADLLHAIEFDHCTKNAGYLKALGLTPGS